MEARQRGIPKTEIMREIMQILNDPKITPETRSHMVEVINNAYQIPVYPSREQQSLAINSFGQRSRLECLEKFR